MNKFTFSDINKKFDNKIVLDNISGSVENGVIGILGTNGVGKTTLIRIFSGLLPVEAGEFLYNGEKIKLSSKFWRSIIGYLPQAPSLYERMRVNEFLDYMLLLSGWNNKNKRIERIEYVLNLLNLDSYKNIPIGHLSGGTKQRVAIGQAIIHNPDVLFLDEPTNNLDAEERIRFHNHLSLNFNGKIVFYIGHVIDELMPICSKILILAEGKIKFYDSPEKLIQSMDGRIKFLQIEKNNARSLHKKLKILRINRNEENLIVFYDSSFHDISEGKYIKPTLENAYLAFLNLLANKSSPYQIC